MFTTTLLLPAWGASVARPAWSAEGTRWDASTSLPQVEVDRFNELWTTRFFDSAGLQAYLDRPGLYEDGFNALSDEEKAALVVGLIQHWQATLPEFGRDMWTGVKADDQKAFEQLAFMLYVTIFAKDEFLAAIQAPGPAAATLPGGLPVDAGHADFAGKSHEDIVAYFDDLHAANTVVTPRPPVEDLGLAPHLVPGQETLVAAPPMPGGGEATGGLPDLGAPDGQLEVLSPEDLLSLLPIGTDAIVPVNPDPNALLNLVAGGTYLACGGVGESVSCAPAPVPLGVPVTLDVNGDLIPDVSVLLGPTVNPEFALTGFAADLRVDRVVSSALPTWGPLPARVWVVYNVPGAATQVLAGFDARDGTLGDTQEVRVTLQDIARALAGDLRLTGELTRGGPGQTLTLLAGFAPLDVTQFPALVGDTTNVALKFDPVPSSLRTDLRFTRIGNQGIIEGSVDASLSPTVTATIDLAQGDLRRQLVGIVHSMPTEIDFRVVSEAVGAVQLDYVANGPFPRFELHDKLTPDKDVPTTYSTLDAVVNDIPREIHFSITRPFNVAYTASGPVDDASVVIVSRDAKGIVSSMGATARGVPSQWSVTGTTSPIRINYAANAAVSSIDAALSQRNPSGTTSTVYTASIVSLPPVLRISVDPNEIVVDARSSPAAAPGSAAIGSISGKYSTDGVIIPGAGNHANLFQTPSVTRASLGYSGLKYIRVSQVNDNLAVDVQNSAPRVFTASVDTPEAYLTLAVDAIPARVTVTGAGTTFTYNAHGATVDSITASFWDKEATQVVAALRGLPGSATMNVDLPASSITYTASSAITGIDVDAWVSQWYGRLRIAGVPTAWSASFGGGSYSFDAFPQSIASVEAAVTNHGAYTTLAGNHLNFDHVASTGVTDASFRMTNVQRAAYSRAGSNQNVDLRMGGGTNFLAVLEATLAAGDRAYAYASFAPLPSSIQATIGEKLVVSTNQNFDTYIYGEYGTPAALATAPTPPYVHGISVRDGQSGTAKALKASLWLTGLPTSVTFDARNTTFGFTNWRPSQTTLVADAELDNFVSPAVDLYVSQSGIPNPQSLTFTMTSQDVLGTKRVRTDLVQSAAMGALFAEVTSGGLHGRVTVSNIPDDIHGTLSLANGVTTFAWDATAAINSVFAGFRVVAQSASFQGYVSLAQLPSDFTLTVGRASGGQGPTLSYLANADTLDASAYTDASLFGGDLKARLSFGLTNLGRDADIFLSGSGVRFTSSPATSNVFTDVWANYNYYREASGVWDEGGFVEFPWAYHLGVNPNINRLSVSLSSFSDFSLGWGVTSELTGTYSSFSFGWDSFTVNLHAYGKVQIVVDWPWPFGSSTITLVNEHYHPPTINVDVLFHRYTNHQGSWFGTSGSVICDWSLSTTLRPHPHGATWNSVATSSATAEGGSWYVTPNPWGAVPSWGVDLVARYTSPDGGSGPGLDFGFDC